MWWIATITASACTAQTGDSSAYSAGETERDHHIVAIHLLLSSVLTYVLAGETERDHHIVAIHLLLSSVLTYVQVTFSYHTSVVIYQCETWELIIRRVN